MAVIKPVLLLALAISVFAVDASADSPAWPAPVATIAPPEGLIAPGFAVSPDGSQLAYVQLANTWSVRGTLKIVTILGGTEEARMQHVPVPCRLSWALPGRVIVIASVGARTQVWSVSSTGPLAQKTLPPTDRAEVVSVAGAQAIVTYNRVTRPAVVHQVASYSVDGLLPQKAVTLAESRGRIDHPDGKLLPLWWEDGSTVLFARGLGAYDKAKDLRLPHQLVRLDVLANTTTSEALDNAGFARVTAEHKARPGQTAFVYLRGGVQLIAHGTARTLRLAHPARDYYTGSLHHQLLSGERLLFSATSRRQRNEPDRVELYVVDVRTGEPRMTLALPGKLRFISWHAAGSRVAVLRMQDGAKGGPSVDLHDLDVN